MERCLFTLQAIEMTGVVDSRRHDLINLETLFLMEMRALHSIDFAIRIARLKCARFSLFPITFEQYHFERGNQASGR